MRLCNPGIKKVLSRTRVKAKPNPRVNPNPNPTYCIYTRWQNRTEQPSLNTAPLHARKQPATYVLPSSSDRNWNKAEKYQNPEDWGFNLEVLQKSRATADQPEKRAQSVRWHDVNPSQHLSPWIACFTHEQQLHRVLSTHASICTLHSRFSFALSLAPSIAPPPSLLQPPHQPTLPSSLHIIPLCVATTCHCQSVLLSCQPPATGLALGHSANRNLPFRLAGSDLVRRVSPLRGSSTGRIEGWWVMGKEGRDFKVM